MRLYNKIIEKIRGKKKTPSKQYELYQDLSSNAFVRFLELYGNQGLKVTSLVGRFKGFKDAVESEVGKEILEDLMKKIEMLLPKIIDLSASKNEYAEYRVMLSLMERWTKK